MAAPAGRASRAGRPWAAATGLAADRLLGEPPTEPHPVAAFGALMTRVERAWYRDTRLAGLAYAATGVLVGAACGLALARFLPHPAGPAAATYLAAAGRSLRMAAGEIHHRLVAGDLAGARGLLPTLVGRDPSELDEAGVAAAVIESVAENTVDAVVAPALWAAAGGAPAALAYRAVNTMDAMVGYRDDRYARFGWAAARLDDAANWVPARLTAVLVAAARPDRAVNVLRAVRRDSPAHPSPNAGVAEGAFAAALGVELGGPLHYRGRAEVRPRLGEGPRPAPGDIERAVALARDVETALAAVLAAAGVLAAKRSHREERR